MLEYQYLNYWTSPNSHPILRISNLGLIPPKLTNFNTQSPQNDLERDNLMERNTGYGDGFPSSGATGPSYGPGVRYGDPRRPYNDQNVGRSAYDARYVPGYPPHSTPYPPAAPAYPEPSRNFGHQNREYEAPYHEPYPHLDRNRYPISQNQPLAP